MAAEPAIPLVAVVSSYPLLAEAVEGALGNRRGPRVLRRSRRHRRLPSAPAAGGGRGRQCGRGRGGGRIRPRGACPARARVSSRGSSSSAARRPLAEPLRRLGVTGADPQRSSSRDLPKGGTYVNAERSAIAAPLVFDEAGGLTVAELLGGASTHGGGGADGLSGGHLPPQTSPGSLLPSSLQEPWSGRA